MTTPRLKIFISSVQNEFSQQRRDLKAFLLGDAVLHRFIAEVFLFEDLPAKDRRADAVYLEEVQRCDIYIGIFGYDYGSQDKSGLSPTEREFDHATEKGKVRLVYVWGSDEKKRSPGMKRLIGKASNELIRRRIENFHALANEVYASLVDYLDDLGALRMPPFDTAPCAGATLKQISRKHIDWFLQTARQERGFSLKLSSTSRSLLTHLNLLDNNTPTNAAVLLFGTAPQRFHRTAETKCVHCHGTDYGRPFASQQIFSGTLFEQADQARDFVLSKINWPVGRRQQSNLAAVSAELPPDAISEAIINALAHRDYNSKASVEVRLFADRLEVWNPGRLPGTLTLADLRMDHHSVPNNPLIAEPLYLTRYIEKAGSGTQMMIAACRDAGLPEPDFEQRSGAFVITIWRDWLTDKVMAELELNERQQQTIFYLKEKGIITNTTYQDEFGTSKRTASRNLNELVQKGVLEKIGTTGKGVQYRLAKGAIKGPKGP